MHKARAFFFVCAGLLCLALAYHFGARSATAQAPGNPVVATFGGNKAVVTANGDVYEVLDTYVGPWHRSGNVFGSATPSTAQPTWGQVKARYATPAPGKVTR